MTARAKISERGVQSGQPIRLVIAEDQALVLGAIAALLGLEADFIIVGRALDGAEALAMVRSLSPDVVLTDIEMPRMSGIELAQAISAERLGARVVIVTTFARAGYLRRALAAGVRGYLLKDTPTERLAEAVRAVARGGRAIAPELVQTIWDEGDDPLSDRERIVLRLAEEGLSNKTIARMVDLAPGTVRNYLSDAATKLGAANRIEAARIARARGWL